ncbi:MAG: hypothetical protein JO211_09990 [Acidobacteriaceae bacterium]|nr:hypothetical protein [Acidobacteriaceae bacterium]
MRRSRRQSKLELLKMWLGSYPFRCNNCNQRFWINIWLFSKLAYAKCPKCLGSELTSWPRRNYRLSFFKNLLSTFGAHRYRCAACRHNFLSFRPTEAAITAESEPEFDIEPESLPEPAPEVQESPQR